MSLSLTAKLKMLSTSILDIKKFNVWAHWHTVQLHHCIGIGVHPFTVTFANLAKIWTFLESKWCWWDYFLVEAGIHLKLLPTSILEVFEHIGMLSIGMQVHPYTVTPPKLAQIWDILGFVLESKWHHYAMLEADIHIRLLPTSKVDVHKVF